MRLPFHHHLRLQEGIGAIIVGARCDATDDETQNNHGGQEVLLHGLAEFLSQGNTAQLIINTDTYQHADLNHQRQEPALTSKFSPSHMSFSSSGPLIASVVSITFEPKDSYSRL